jgi:hypothetical protein
VGKQRTMVDGSGTGFLARTRQSILDNLVHLGINAVL